MSPQIAAIALQQAIDLNAATKSEWMSVTAPQLAVRFGWSEQYQALQADSDRRRAPQRLLARAIRGYAEGVVSAQTIATLRGMPPDSVATELREAGIFPAQHPIRWADPGELPEGTPPHCHAGAAQRARRGRSRGVPRSSPGPAFRPAAAVWKKLTPTWIQVLPDDLTPELARVVNRITQRPLAERLKQSKDLGETMVIGPMPNLLVIAGRREEVLAHLGGLLPAHAVVAAEAGADVIVLIDDGLGAQTATREVRRLGRQRTTDGTIGSITLASTLTILEKAAGTPYINDKAQMREIYRRLRSLDDGLPAIEKTALLTTTRWKSGT